jgi:hypothetical protein
MKSKLYLKKSEMIFKPHSFRIYEKFAVYFIYVIMQVLIWCKMNLILGKKTNLIGGL